MDQNFATIEVVSERMQAQGPKLESLQAAVQYIEIVLHIMKDHKKAPDDLLSRHMSSQC